MKTIYKFPVPLEDKFTIKSPRIIKVLALLLQDNKPFIWCKIDLSIDSVFHHDFQIVGTGNEIPEHGEYVGTFQQDGYVWHLFQIIPF